MSEHIETEIKFADACLVCGDDLSLARPGVGFRPVRGYSTKVIHFDCIDDLAEQLKSLEEEANNIIGNWGQVGDDLKEIEELLESIPVVTQHKFFDRVMEHWKTLFPNGLRSKRIKVGEEVSPNILEDMGVEAGSKGWKIAHNGEFYISPNSLGIGYITWRYATQCNYPTTADGFRDSMPSILAHQDKIKENLSAYNDRERKFSKFVGVMEEILDEDLLVPDTSEGSTYWIYKTHLTNPIKFGGDTIKKLGVRTTTPDSISYYKWNSISLNPDQFSSNDFQTLAQTNLLQKMKTVTKKAKENAIQKKEKFQDKIDYLEDELSEYLMAVAL